MASWLFFQFRKSNRCLISLSGPAKLVPWSLWIVVGNPLLERNIFNVKMKASEDRLVAALRGTTFMFMDTKIHMYALITVGFLMGPTFSQSEPA